MFVNSSLLPYNNISDVVYINLNIILNSLDANVEIINNAEIK